MDPVSIAAVGWGISTAGWLVSPIISKLLNKCSSYLGFRSSDELEKLESKVLQMKLMLEAAEANPQRGRLEQWTTKLKSAFYEAEDILDEIDYHQLENSVLSKTNFRRRTKQDAEINVPRLLREKLEFTLKRIETLINQGQGLLPWVKLPATCCNIKNTPNNTVTSPTRTTTSTPPVEVFGREDDRKMIRRMLRDTPAADKSSSSRTKCYSVIGIHGIPGSGKTTLAQYVCKHEREDAYFDLVMWIHVSQNFSVNTVFTEMLEIASSKKQDQLCNLDMLQRELEAKLRGKRFFLVLDDVWKGVSDQQLDRLLSPLMVGKMGSKILVTTRSADAARALGAQKPVSMPEMDKDRYLKMFMYYALGTMSSDQALFTEHYLIGRKIAEKLRRSPLAARTVAGQLRRRLDIDFWRRSLNRDLFSDTMGALWWSYQQLEEHVKQCFTYCSMFPRRYQLQRDELVHLWIAQGFVGTEDIGYDCFDVLRSCSFIQPKGKLTSGIEYFTVHDLLHELAERVAGSDCFRFEKGKRVDQIPRDVRHLFISYGVRVPTEQILKLRTLRTLIMSGYAEKMTKEDFERMLMSLKKLRVVHVRLEILHEIPSCIGQLKHLRYLRLYGSDFVKIILPPTFTKLYHLQKFYVSRDTILHCSSGVEMPNLVNLRRILCREFNFPNIGRMTWLRTLRVFRVRKTRGYEIQQLEHLDNLRGTLNIEGLENVDSGVEARQAKLDKKVHVSDLALDWKTYKISENHDGRKSKNSFRPPRHFRIQEDVLEALRPPPGITSLEIKNYSGSTYPSWLSGKQGTLQNLKCLHFSSCNGLDAPLKISKFLVYLRKLIVSYCSWKSLPENMEHLKSLEELIIGNCSEIRSLPRLPKSLKKLSLSQCNRSLVKSCQTVGHPNRQKIEHIPEKRIF
ncbi:putative disease resistance RPP13-like protein 1 [Phragmites australis]|uniref:putative disease resistance RPP13-like protein 1 n=1 Tax=Phragmites australis TaxID=29695 RepID=UPI002D7950D9|nr:putative disease resistance RPP13-like protein 1 [Phragmites australis]